MDRLTFIDYKDAKNTVTAFKEHCDANGWSYNSVGLSLIIEYLERNKSDENGE